MIDNFVRGVLDSSKIKSSFLFVKIYFLIGLLIAAPILVFIIIKYFQYSVRFFS
jgi:hypothetical protein